MSTEPISALPAATALTGSELTVLVQGGSTVQSTVASQSAASLSSVSDGYSGTLFATVQGFATYQMGVNPITPRQFGGVGSATFPATTDDHVALAAAISYCKNNNVPLLLDRFYGTSVSINLPAVFTLTGVGSRQCGINWVGASTAGFDKAVLQSVYPVLGTTTFGLMFSCQVSHIQVHAQSLVNCAFACAGWQENSSLSDGVIAGGLITTLAVLSSPSPSHIASFYDLHVIGPSNVTNALQIVDLSLVQNCTFEQITVTSATSAGPLVPVGVNVESNSLLNTFANIHLEQCGVGIQHQGTANVFQGIGVLDNTAAATSAFTNTGASFQLFSMRVINGVTNAIVNAAAAGSPLVASYAAFDVGYYLFETDSGAYSVISDRGPQQFRGAIAASSGLANGATYIFTNPNATASTAINANTASGSGGAAFSGNRTGSDGMILQGQRGGAAGPGFAIGTGSPQGIDVGYLPFGSIWARLDVTPAEPALLVKKSGSGVSTGWEALTEIQSGSTANRPATTTVGLPYFDTTLGYPVWLKSTGVWVNGAGATV